MPRILVVEDDPDLLFLYNTALSQGGFEVIMAENGKIAMSYLDQEHFDLVMLDLNMPDAHGGIVVSHLRKNKQHDDTRIIIVTANDHWLDDVLEHGVDQILVKPISMKDVVAAVNRYTR